MPLVLDNDGISTMRTLTAVLRLVGAIQIVLGLYYALAPGVFLEAIGHTVPDDDVFYPLAMLASRFLAMGAAFWWISGRPHQSRTLVDVMIAIQGLDLVAGVLYTATGVVPLSLSGFPMFNAAWIAAVLVWLRPTDSPSPARLDPSPAAG